MVKTWHNPKLKAVPPPVLDDALGYEPLPAPVTTEDTGPPVRLAVCPYCRTVSELEPKQGEPVKLMVCWRCAEQHADPALAAPPPLPEPQPAWLDAPESDGKLMGGYGMLLLVLLGCGYVGSQLWFESRTPAPAATRPVSVVATDPNPAARADEPARAPASELVLAPPAAGRDIAEKPPAEPPPSAEAVPARAPPAQAACTSGAAALGLCNLDPANRRP
jgi:hypothetical protein